MMGRIEITSQADVRMKTSLFLITAAAVAIAVPAQASDLGWESQGSFRVSVTIAPLGAALGAAQGGAQGLWTIGGGGRGLMLDAPKEIGAGEAREMALFAAQTSALTVTSSDLEVSYNGTKSDRGLNRLGFVLKARDDRAKGRPATLVISTL